MTASASSRWPTLLMTLWFAAAALPATAHDASNMVQSPAAAPAQNRNLETVMADFNAAMGEFRAVMSGVALGDPAQRMAIAPKAIPILKRLEALRKEFASAGTDGVGISQQIGCQFQQLLLGFGDADTLAQTKLLAADKDPKVAAVANRDLMFADWVQKSTPSEQSKLLDSAQATANQSPQDISLSQTLVLMSQIGASTPDLGRRAKSIAAGMQTPLSANLRAEVAADQKIHSFEDKPLVISGKTVEGKSFSTADWKGKVILVDFWATWCGPCCAELPRVKKMYSDYHGKGLEILGVSNDYDAKTLENFTAADPGMPWPQLFDAKAGADQQWNPTTLSFGIEAIPEMFLIDRQGILRSVDALADLEVAIPKMLQQ